MDKYESKKIINDILQGDLKGAKDVFLLEKKVDNKFLTNVLSAICHLTNKQIKNVEPCVKDVKTVTLLCCNKFEELTEKEYLSYLQALFYIFKFLFKKISLLEIPELCALTLSSKFSISLSKPTKDMYLHFTTLFHNDIIIPHSKNLSDLNTLTKILTYCLQLHCDIFEEYSELFFSKFLSYITLLDNIDKSKCTKFCSEILEMLKTEGIDRKEYHGKEAYNVLTFVLYIFLSLKESPPCIDFGFELLEKFYIDEEKKMCIKMFRLFYLLFYEINEVDVGDIRMFKKLNENLNLIINQFGVTSSFSVVVNYMYRYIMNKFEGIDKKLKNKWKSIMNIELLREYIRLFHKIGFIMSEAKCMDKQKEYYEQYQAVLISHMGLTFYLLSLRCDMDDIRIVLDKSYTYIEDCFKYIKVLKNNNCPLWVQCWRIVGVTLFNISIKIHTQNKYDLTMKLYKMFCKYVILFEGVENTNICFENALGTTLSSIGVGYLNLKEYRKALTYLGYGILICPDLRSKYWQNWCSIKAKANNDNIVNVSTLTIYDILRIDEEIIKEIHPTYKFQPKLMEDLLILELESYSKIWSSKIPISITCKQLFTYGSDVIKQITGLHIAWEKAVNVQDQELMKCIQKTINILSKKQYETSIPNQICLSIAYFIDFQFKWQETLKKNLSEMNDANLCGSLTNSSNEETNDGNEANCNDLYDVTALYNNRIENIFHIHKSLAKSLELWEKLLTNKELLNFKELINQLNLDNYIKLAAYNYRIQNFSVDMLKCWFIYLSFGTLFKKPGIIITSIGHIIECCGIGNKEICKLVENAEKNHKFLSKDVNTSEILTLYYLNKSAGCLLTNLLNDGITNLSQAEKHLEEIPNEKHSIYKSRILFLKSKYLQKPCISKLIDHDQNYIVLLQNSFTSSADHYKSNAGKCLYTLSILFEISSAIAWMYKWLRMTREIRCYTQEPVLLAQQMVLPIRTADLMSALAYADLMNCQYDACRVKLSGISYILCYNNMVNITKEVNEIMADQKVEKVSKKLENLVISEIDNPIEMMLDVPLDHKIKNLQGSPILTVISFKMPSFTNHSDCNCVFCSNVDYHRLILDYFRIEAVYYLRQQNVASSLEFFKGGMQFYENISNKVEYLCSRHESDFIDIFKQQLIFSYSMFLMDYSLYFTRFQKYVETDKILIRILELLGDNIHTNYFFYTELLLYKLNLFTATKAENTRKSLPMIHIETVENNKYLEKTPENKVSIATVSPVIDLIEESFPIKKMRNIRINIFKESDDESTEKKTPKMKREKKFALKTPMKTPNISKFMLNTKNTEETKLKDSSVKIELTKSPISNESRVKKTKILETRTKLLTTKLKTEINTPLKAVKNIETTEVIQKKVSVKSSKATISRRVVKKIANNKTDTKFKCEIPSVKQTTKSIKASNSMKNKAKSEVIETQKKCVTDSEKSSSSSTSSLRSTRQKKIVKR